jgi:hypothetical protein
LRLCRYRKARLPMKPDLDPVAGNGEIKRQRSPLRWEVTAFNGGVDAGLPLYLNRVSEFLSRLEFDDVAGLDF